MTKKIFLIILILLLILPPFFHGGKDYFIYPLLLIGAGLLILLLKSDFNSLNWWRNPLFYFVLFLILGLFSVFFSISFWDSISEYLKWLSCFILFGVVSLILFSKKELKYLIFIFLGTEGVIALIGLYFYLNSFDSRATSTFYEPNAFAGYLLFSLPIFLGLFLKEKNKEKAVILGVISVFVFSIFTLTGSRSAYLSFLLPFFVLCYIFFKNYPKKELFLKLISLVLGVFLLTNFLFSLKTGDNFLPTPQKFLTLLRYESLSDVDFTAPAQARLTGRLDYWKGALKIFKERPLYGSGLGTFSLAYPLYQKGPLDYASSAHSDYIQLLSEIGILGMLPFLLLIFALIWIGINLIRNIRKGMLLGCLIFLGILGSLSNSIFTYNWLFLANFITFWILAGLMVNYFLNKNEKID